MLYFGRIPFMRLLGCSDALLPLALEYLIPLLPGCIFILIQTIGTFIIRLDGAPKFASAVGIVPGVPEKPLRQVLAQDISTWKEDLRNDFEATVFQKYPALSTVKDMLYGRGAVYAAMSGSGSAFFGIYKD